MDKDNIVMQNVSCDKYKFGSPACLQSTHALISRGLTAMTERTSK